MPSQFQDFGTGVVPLSGFFYFLGIAAAMLYLNMVLLGRRHWAGGEASGGRWLHSVVRFALGAPGPVQPRPSWSNLWSASPGRRQRREAPHPLARVARPGQPDPRRPAGDDPGLLQPGGPARVRRDQGHLLGLLREYAAESGGRIQLNLVPTELYSDEARDAEKRYGIKPRRVFSTDQAQQMADRRLSWAWRSPRASRRSSSRSSTGGCRWNTS